MPAFARAFALALLLSSPAVAQVAAPITAPSAPSDSRPVPDPTLLTTQALQREITSLQRELAAQRELVLSILNGQAEKTETRFSAMDKAIGLIQGAADKVPSATDLAIARLRDLHDERFNGVEKQFRERDVRTEQKGKDDKVAIDAALQAQKQAVDKQNEANDRAINKSEAWVAKQIDQLVTLFQNMARNTDSKLDDLKSRVTAMEGHSKGTGDSWGFAVGAGGIVIGIASLVVAGFAFSARRSS